MAQNLPQSLRRIPPAVPREPTITVWLALDAAAWGC